MKIILHLAVVFFVSVLLVSCEGNTDYYFHIQNATDQQLVIKTVNWSSDTVIMKVYPNSKEQVFTVNQLGGVINPQNMSDYLIYLEVYNTLGKTITIDPLDQIYWSRSTEVRSKIPANYGHYYLLEVNENHFN